MENITINKLELACELAAKRTALDMDNIGAQTYADNGDGTSSYTEEAQDIFNEYYDEYLTLIESIN